MCASLIVYHQCRHIRTSDASSQATSYVPMCCASLAHRQSLDRLDTALRANGRVKTTTVRIRMVSALIGKKSSDTCLQRSASETGGEKSSRIPGTYCTADCYRLPNLSDQAAMTSTKPSPWCCQDRRKARQESRCLKNRHIYRLLNIPAQLIRERWNRGEESYHTRPRCARE